MSTIERFINFFAKFRTLRLWADMERCVENSPWHREPNTAAHTVMMLQWYMENMWDHRTERQRLLTLIGIVFHDVGKPIDRRWSPEKNRFHFAGHEQTSAKMFDVWTRHNTSDVIALGLSPDDLQGLYWMLYRHVPFAFGNDLTRDLKKCLIELDAEIAFLDLVMSDQYGRISDEHQANLDNVFVWLERWTSLKPLTSIRLDLYPRKVPHLSTTGYVAGTIEIF